MKEKLLVSACLLGEPCRYDGKSKPCKNLASLSEKYDLIPVCPEVLGGLDTPRLPCEIVGNRVLRSDGEDCTEPYQKGAEKALLLALKFGCKKALLKEKSPSCGTHLRYDGTFSGNLIEKAGITSAMLMENGITVFSENEIKAL